MNPQPITIQICLSIDHVTKQGSSYCELLRFTDMPVVKQQPQKNVVAAALCTPVNAVKGMRQMPGVERESSSHAGAVQRHSMSAACLQACLSPLTKGECRIGSSASGWRSLRMVSQCCMTWGSVHSVRWLLLPYCNHHLCFAEWVLLISFQPS